MMDMNELRSQIDNIDDQLVKLFVERMDIAEKIGAYKKANNLPVFDIIGNCVSYYIKKAPQD